MPRLPRTRPLSRVLTPCCVGLSGQVLERQAVTAHNVYRTVLHSRGRIYDPPRTSLSGRHLESVLSEIAIQTCIHYTHACRMVARELFTRGFTLLGTLGKPLDILCVSRPAFRCTALQFPTLLCCKHPALLRLTPKRHISPPALPQSLR